MDTYMGTHTWVGYFEASATTDCDLINLVVLGGERGYAPGQAGQRTTQIGLILTIIITYRVNNNRSTCAFRGAEPEQPYKR